MRFTAQYEGHTFARVSRTRMYTHLVIARRADGTLFDARWATNEDAANTPLPGWDRVAIVEVRKEEPMARKTEPKPDTDELITKVHDTADSIRSATDKETVDRLAAEAEDVIRQLPTAKRTALRKAVKDAVSEQAAKSPASSTAVEVKSGRVAEDWREFDGVPELITEGVKAFREGISLGRKMGNVGERVAQIMLDMRTRIPNPSTGGLPDLLAERKTTKNAAMAVYREAAKALDVDDVEGHSAHRSLMRATQNKASDVLVEWLRSFDGPDRDETVTVMTQIFGEQILSKVEDGKPLSEAVYALYSEHGVKLPRYGRKELARFDRRIEAIEAATRELDALQDSDNEDDVRKAEELEGRIRELKSEVPDAILKEKLDEKQHKSDAERTAEALTAARAQISKAGKRYARVTDTAAQRKAKAELYALIKEAVDAFELDLSALLADTE